MNITSQYGNNLDKQSTILCSKIANIEHFLTHFKINFSKRSKGYSISCPKCSGEISLIKTSRWKWKCVCGIQTTMFDNLTGLLRIFLNLKPGLVCQRMEDYCLASKTKGLLSEGTANFILTFGKYKGKRIRDVIDTLAYLNWIAGKCPDCIPNDVKVDLRNYLGLPPITNSSEHISIRF